MTHAERLALRHAVNLLLSSTDTEKVVHRERLRQAREAVVAELDAEQQKADEAAAYVRAWDARSRKLAEQAAANLCVRHVCGHCRQENYCRAHDQCHYTGSPLNSVAAQWDAYRSVGGN